MPRIPFIGRLNITEYLALVGSFFLVGLEAIIRVLTLALPTSIIQLFYRASRRLFNRFTSPRVKRSVKKRDSVSTSIRDASDFVDLCRLSGYYAEEHVVQTKDGYLLGIHRLGWRRGEEDIKVNAGPHSVKKRVVYLHHGLLMNSEVWVCQTDQERSLAFYLVERGYDVWLGNNRGNKYSKKCIHYPPTSLAFWDFSMDEFAFHDIPDTIDYILSTTGQESLSYIGFSQGTAQAFATLSIHPTLNEKVNVFIALAPAMAPAGLRNGIVDSLMKASPSFLFLLFGRRSILSSATMWQSILYPPLFCRFIDISLSFLFGWQTRNISTSQKLAAYPHLYSFTSVKSVVHWFQIIRNKSFQMYDDDIQRPLALRSVSKYTKVAKFPTRNIKTPICLVWGGSDSLIDINVMLKELPPQTIATEIPHFEHLDFLWGREVDALVFPHVLDALDSFTNAEHTKEDYAKYRAARHASLKAGARRPSIIFSEADDDRSPISATYAEAASLNDQIYNNEGEAEWLAGNGNGKLGRENASSGLPSLSVAGAERRVRISSSGYNDSSESSNVHVRTVPSPTTAQLDGAADVDGGESLVKDQEEDTATEGERRKNGKRSNSFEGSLKGGKGISLGVGKAVGGVVSKVSGSWSDTDGGERKKKR